MDKKVQEILYEANESRIKSANHWANITERIIEDMTPIEQLLYVALDLIYSEIKYQWTIKNQVKIGNYRVDFLLQCHCFVYESIDSRNGKYGKAEIIIECDGHDFHEKTKEQIARDKKRDRDLQGMGFMVLRFSGSEIWKDPYACAEEIKKKAINQIIK